MNGWWSGSEWVVEWEWVGGGVGVGVVGGCGVCVCVYVVHSCLRECVPGML